MYFLTYITSVIKNTDLKIGSKNSVYFFFGILGQGTKADALNHNCFEVGGSELPPQDSKRVN